MSTGAAPAPPAGQPAPTPPPGPTPSPAPAPQPAPSPAPDPGGDPPEGFVPRRRLNEVEADRRRLQTELEQRQAREEEARRREESAVQRAERERDEARQAEATARSELQRVERSGIFQRAALSSATPIRSDALEAAIRLVNLDVCDTPEHAADAVTDLVTRYPFLAGQAEPTPPPRIGAPVGGGNGGPGAPNAGGGQQAPTPEESRSGLARWLAGNVLGTQPTGPPPA